MTEKECLAAGIAVSLFAHFALLIAPRPPDPEPSFTTVVQMDMASPAVATSREKGIGIAAASPPDMDKADAADRKRQAFLRYLDDIDEAVREAEQFAAEDKKQREAADIRNQADQMVFQTEKTLEDMGDKIPASDRNSVESALNHLKETQKGSDVEAIKAATEELTKAFYAVSEKLYQQNGGQAGPGPDMGGANFGGQAGGSGAGPDVVDADYEVVDDDKK